MNLRCQPQVQTYLIGHYCSHLLSFHIFRGAWSAPPKAPEHGRFVVRRRHQWRRGYENGAGGETPQTAAPTRIAGRCDLRRRRKGASALSRTFFFSRPTSRPGGPAFFRPSPYIRLTGRNRAFPVVGWGRDAIGRESPHKPPHKGKQQGTGREGLSALPLSVYIAISGTWFWSKSSAWFPSACSAMSCCDVRNRITMF